MIKQLFINYKNNLILLIIFSAGIFYRLYNANFEDYWFDEFFGFWISDPQLSFNQTLERSFGPGFGQNLLFDFILKYFFLIFGYYPENGRIFTAIISALCIPLITFLSYQIDKSKSYLFCAFLISHCWYLISYAQEVRSYSIGYFFSLLSIILFISILRLNSDNFVSKYFLSIFFILINILGLINHIFFVIVIFSQFLFSLNFFDNKKKLRLIIFNFLIIGTIYLIFMYPFLAKNLSSDSFWISQVGPSFFIDYFFPRFFGSKIMGYLYLFSLTFLIFKFYKLIFSLKSIYQLLFILLISAYIVPLMYGMIKIPILIDRYIIFVITPILLLISSFVYRLPVKLKWIMIILISITTFANNYIEIFERQNSKPEFNKVLSEISKRQDAKIQIIADSEENYKYILNYLSKINYSKYNDFNYIQYKSPVNEQFFWSICYLPLNGFNCEKNFINTNYKINIVKNFFLIDVVLFEKIN